MDMATRVDQLKAIPLFSGLAQADLQFVADRMDEVSIPAGTVMITEGAGNHVFFVILEGLVDVSVAGKHRRTLGPHDFFGEISMMELDPATATVASRTPVRAFVVSRAQFSTVKAHETVMLQLKAARSQRLHADRKLKE
jgi:CRP/FNR family cyclic AMP-dependent transcriptional regulator